ncbi:MAG: DUF89 domain-containing protein [Marinifilaceae bacterium]
MHYQCFFCHIRSFEKLLKEQPIKEEDKKNLTLEFLNWFGKMNRDDKSPDITRSIHQKMKEILGSSDPYREIKKSCNDYLLQQYPRLKERVLTSKDPFTTALKLAIAGNIIDYAASPDHSVDETIEYVMESDFAINHVQKLKERIQKAKTILYLGDNAGEIVLDRLFLETLNHPGIHFAVRGEPIINDVTLEDARYVQMERYAKVISNGYGAPSTLVEKSSAEFQDLFYRADLIISKGQGNLEGLLENQEQSIFYLLMVKCNLIGSRLGVEKGNFVVCHNKEIPVEAEID